MSTLPLAPVFPDLLAMPRAAVEAKPQATGLRQTWPVIVVTLAIGTAAVVWSYFSNTILAYGDAQAHLAIARRVLDSRTPGVAGFGTVWLPVPHMLLMLLVYIDPLWRTGLAGSIIGVGCLVVTAVSLYLSVLLLTDRKSMAWLGVAVLLSNPNLLYIHTTALTEPVLIASMTVSTYYLLKWTKDHRWPDLITAGVLAAGAVGSRYEGWGFAAACTAMVAWITYFLTSDRFKAEGSALGYVAPAVYTMGMWAFYNWLIFGDPLSFARSQFSAAAFAEAGAAPTKAHLGLSVTVLQEGLRGLTVNPGKTEVAEYMRQNYRGGGILIDESASDWATLAGIHEKEYIATFNGQLFQDAVNHPADSVKWVVISQNPDPDKVGAVLLPSALFQRQFRLVQTFGTFKVYERADG